MICILICITFDLFPQVNCHVDDLYEDLRNGLNLISLLEVLTSTKLVRSHTVAIFFVLFIFVHFAWNPVKTCISTFLLYFTSLRLWTFSHCLEEKLLLCIVFNVLLWMKNAAVFGHPSYIFVVYIYKNLDICLLTATLSNLYFRLENEVTCDFTDWLTYKLP